MTQHFHSPWLLVAAILFTAAACVFKAASERAGDEPYLRLACEGSAVAAFLCFVGHIARALS